MTTKIIKLYAVQDIYDFITEAEKVKGDVNVSRGKHMIDGKSILGLMALDVTRPFCVDYPKENEETFGAFLDKFSN